MIPKITSINFSQKNTSIPNPLMEDTLLRMPDDFGTCPLINYIPKKLGSELLFASADNYSVDNGGTVKTPDAIENQKLCPKTVTEEYPCYKTIKRIIKVPIQGCINLYNPSLCITFEISWEQVPSTCTRTFIQFVPCQ